MTDKQKNILIKLIQENQPKKIRTNTQIAELVGCTLPTVRKYTTLVTGKEIKVEDLPDKDGRDIKKFLEDNWHFTGRVIGQKDRIESNYRTVRKGERGHLRTPYRTDGRFQ